MNRTVLIAVTSAALAVAAGQDEVVPTEPQWWKGNTHTHTLWSDGLSAPETVVDWYRAHDYDFLVLSDHNHMQTEERWFTVDDGRLQPEDVDELKSIFGDRAVETRDWNGQPQMRLQTLTELQLRFARPGEFLLIPGEEITCNYRRKTESGFHDHPIHVNAINLATTIPPRGGDSPADLMNAIVRDVNEHAATHQRSVLSHVNHPIENAALSVQDIASLTGDRFFEIHNGLRSCPSQAEGDDPSIEDWWDEANTIRCEEPARPLLYGIASDDAHRIDGEPEVQAGRAWIVVRSPSLDAASLIEAMRKGDYYASTGVDLEDIQVTREAYTVDVQEREGVKHRVKFFGLRQGETEVQILMEGARDPAVYTWRGDEVWVRAKVITDRPHLNPQHADEVERAWTQPFRRPAASTDGSEEPGSAMPVEGSDGD
tara:strand:- start:5122 stop:6405 length:1284 start_codon:yes stop_codon:yes gene_type:complete